jgi:hypothetical protein
MLGFASLASAGGLGREIAVAAVVAVIVLGAGEGVVTFGVTVSTAAGFSAAAGTTGFGGVEVAAVVFVGVVEAVTEAGGIVAVVGAAGEVVVATAAATGQRCP